MTLVVELACSGIRRIQRECSRKYRLVSIIKAIKTIRIFDFFFKEIVVGFGIGWSRIFFLKNTYKMMNPLVIRE
jgi:hypothetical protein